MTQLVQTVMQQQVLVPALASCDRMPGIPLVMRAGLRLPGLRGFLPRLIALGIRRPHVRCPEAPPERA